MHKILACDHIIESVTLSHMTLTPSKLLIMNCSTPSRKPSPLRYSLLAKKRVPTLAKASFGHGWNQSMTVQDTSAGNFRALLRNSGAMGERHKITCSFSLT